MTDLDALKKQKERLLLEREIEILQRQSRHALTFSKLRWAYVVPLGLFGFAVMAIGVAANFPNDPVVGVAFAFVGLLLGLPAILKALWGR